ncbi:MAG: cytochrome c oxidase assembly factor 1 family protein [Eudoraea sp.]|nr:cytochrome c oxidase assembly factor 1 family protein [Eudoraea sp.]
MNNELVPEPSWWHRNWKWVVPVGGCLTLLILAIFFIGSLFYGVSTMFEDSEPYEYAFEKINQDEQLIELLGTPIKKDGMPQGNINWHNNEKHADMRIPIAGPKGKGMLFITAHGEGDNWIYDEIRVTVREDEEFDLLENNWE